MALLLLAVVGLGNTLVDVSAFTLLQRAVPEEVLARAFGAVQALWVATIGIGSIGRAAAHRGSRHPRRAVDHRRAAPDPRHASAPAARAAGRGARPRAGARAAPRHRAVRAAAAADAGESRAGAQPGSAGLGERSSSGRATSATASTSSPTATVEIVIDGRVVRETGPGGYFGEISLLRDVPRTATVRAKGDVELFALDRDDFIAAVTGHDASAEVADSVIATRLGSIRPGMASV